MTISLNNSLKDVILNGVFNDGAGINFNAATLTIRTGAAPGANNAASGTVLATVTTPADAMGTSSGGVIAKSGTWQDTSADASGTAAHFRLTNGTQVIEGTVTATGGGGDMTVDNTSFAATQQFTINTFAPSV